LTSGLHGKVLLCIDYLRLARVTILGDQIASKVREMAVINNLNRALAASDRFAGAGKVIIRFISSPLTRKKENLGSHDLTPLTPVHQKSSCPRKSRNTRKNALFDFVYGVGGIT
jgi:hypothetical protein